MKWSYRLLRVFGIDIRVHATFFIIVVLGALNFRQFYGTTGLWFGALLIIAMFTCVTLHELGHSLVAKRFGVDVKEILLLPIGGVATLRREPSTAAQELLIAIAGPLVNVVIAAVLFLALGADLNVLNELGTFPPPLTLRGFASLVLGANIAIALFNMIPALPMDGGRVLRALLTMALDKQRATSIAAGLGQLLAAGFVVLAVKTDQLVLGLIGAFVFFAAAQERTFQRAAGALVELRAGEVCNPEAAALSPSDQLGIVLDQVLRSPQPAFVVLHGTDLVGVVTRDDVVRAAPVLGSSSTISKIMRRDFVVVEAELKLDAVRSRMLEARGPVVVMSREGVLGVLTYEDIQRVAGVMQELARRGLSRPVPAPAPEA
jgi:Zn-dependent protease